MHVFCICTCSVQLSMFYIERYSRNTLIIIIITPTLPYLCFNILMRSCGLKACFNSTCPFILSSTSVELLCLILNAPVSNYIIQGNHSVSKLFQDMRKALKDFSAGLDNHPNSPDSCMVAIMTHGDENDVLFGVDGEKEGNEPKPGTFIQKEDLRNIFSSSNCRGMEDKPKFFIIQACRGGIVCPALYKFGNKKMYGFVSSCLG